MSKYEYEKPVLNETFDQCAAHVLRECMRHYEEAPAAVKDILENVAINQRHGGPFTDPFGYFDQTEKKVYPTKAAAEMMGCIESELVPIYATRVPEGDARDAARYRFLRTSINCKEFRGDRYGSDRLADKALDAAVDRGIEFMNNSTPEKK